MTRVIRCSASSTPSPAPSIPQLLLTTARSVAPCSSSAAMITHGIPDSPKPPTATTAPSGTSATASAADATTLSITCRSPVVPYLVSITARGGNAGAVTLACCLSTPTTAPLTTLGGVEPQSMTPCATLVSCAGLFSCSRLR